MANDHWTKQTQDQARRGWTAPQYSTPRPSYQERQVRDAVFKQYSTNNGSSTNNSNNGGSKK